MPGFRSMLLLVFFLFTVSFACATPSGGKSQDELETLVVYISQQDVFNKADQLQVTGVSRTLLPDFPHKSINKTITEILIFDWKAQVRRARYHGIKRAFKDMERVARKKFIELVRERLEPGELRELYLAHILTSEYDLSEFLVQSRIVQLESENIFDKEDGAVLEIRVSATLDADTLDWAKVAFAGS